MKTWYAVYTRKDCANKVLYFLIRNNIKYYYPLNRLRVNKKIISKPLFPSYIFIHATEAELQKIQKNRDVINPLYWKDQHVKLVDEELDRIKSFLNIHFQTEILKIDVEIEPFQNANNIKQQLNLQVVNTKANIDFLSIAKLGILLKSERTLAPEFHMKKEQPVLKFLFRLGWTNFI
jgi:transcription antitermination factor NusG